MKYFVEGVQLTPDEVELTTIEEYTDDGFVPRKDMLGTGELVGRRRRVMEADLDELEGIDAVEGVCLQRMEGRIRDMAAIEGRLTDIGCADLDIAGDAVAFLGRRQEGS